MKNKKEKGKNILVYATTKCRKLDDTKPREMNHSQKDTYHNLTYLISLTKLYSHEWTVEWWLPEDREGKTNSILVLQDEENFGDGW